MAALKASFEVLADGTMRVEMEITSERLGTVTVAAAGIVSVLYIFREPICNALRHPDFPHDEPVIEDIQHGPLIVKLHFLTPGSFLRFYDDYKSGTLEDSLAKEIEKLTTKPTPETATTMTVFDESLPVKFKESLEEKFKNLRFDDKLTVKIREEEKVKNHAEKLRLKRNNLQKMDPAPGAIFEHADMRIEMEIDNERLGIITVAAAGRVSMFYIFRGFVRNALRNPDFPHDEPVIEDIVKGSLIVKLRFLTPTSFLRFYDDYKSGKLKDSLKKEIVKLTTKPTPETDTTMTVFDESLPVEFKESLEEKFGTLRFNDRLTVKIRNKEKVENLAEKLRANTVEQQGRGCIIVQGGGYSAMLGDLTGECKEAIQQSVKEGYDVLKTGGTAVDAVEKAVRILEDDPNFNAGRGSVLNDKGEVQCGAMIMNGTSMETGAVIAVSRFPHPVSVAKCVMQRTKHCAMTNDGALDIAKKHGLKIVQPEALVTEEAKKRVDTILGYIHEDFKGEPIEVQCHGTVSAVAMDKNGHFACATSTGGIAGNMKGRVGDAPLVGCGGYANKYGGATTSGHGEAIMKMTLAREVIYSLEQGDSAQNSAEEALKKMEKSVDLGYGGVIVIDRHGNFGIACNTKVMVWASIKDDELKYGMEQNECYTIPLTQEY